MRHWRAREYTSGLAPKSMVAGLGAWAFVAKHRRLYRLAAALSARMLKLVARNGRVRALPLMRNWFAVRDFPAPQGSTFQSLWAKRE